MIPLRVARVSFRSHRWKPPIRDLEFRSRSATSVRLLWLVICARQLHFDPVGVFKVDSVAAPSRVQALALQLRRHSADFVVFNCDAVVIHARIRVLKKCQKVLPKPKEAVRVALSHHGQTKMFLIPELCTAAWT